MSALRRYRLRTILQRPSAVAHAPAILYLPVLGCSSLGRPFSSVGETLARRFAGLVRAGYAVMRVDGMTTHPTLEASCRAYTRGAVSDDVISTTVSWLQGIVPL